jgi:hypothetical protein
MPENKRTDALLTFKDFVRSLSVLSDAEYRRVRDSHYYAELLLLLTEPAVRFEAAKCG